MNQQFVIEPTTNPRMRLAFGSKARTGKDTAANYVIENWSFVESLRFSAPIYSIADHVQRVLGLPVCKDPVLLQTLGQALKQVYGDDVWTKVALKFVSDRVVVTDMRFKGEKKALEEKGFVCVRINRQNRVIDRPADHPSEIDLDGEHFEHIIYNDYSLAHLFAAVRGVIAMNCRVAPVQLSYRFEHMGQTHIYGGLGDTKEEAEKQILEALGNLKEGY